MSHQHDSVRFCDCGSVRVVRRLLSKRVLLGLAGAVVIVATFAYLLPKIADYRDVWRS